MHIAGNYGPAFRERIDILFERPCNILYLGASVTAQKESYCAEFHRLICVTTRHEHTIERRAIGGTGCLMAVWQLRKRPIADKELVFIELLTGDLNFSAQASGDIYIFLMTIVQLVRANGAEPCFLNLYREDKTYKEKIVTEYQRLINDFSVPFINLYSELLGANGESRRAHAFMQPLYRDKIHTTRFGSHVIAAMLLHHLLAGTISESVPPHLAASELSATGVVLDELGVDTGGATPSQGLVRTAPDNDEFRSIVVPIDFVLSFRFTGFIGCILFDNGPDSCNLIFDDGSEKIQLNLFDRLCYYRRLKIMPLYKHYRDALIQLHAAPDPVNIALVAEEHRRMISPQKNIRFCGILGYQGADIS